MARLIAPTSVKGTEPAVVEVSDDRVDELKRRGFVDEGSKATTKKSSSSKSSN